MKKYEYKKLQIKTDFTVESVIKKYEKFPYTMDEFFEEKGYIPNLNNPQHFLDKEGNLIHINNIEKDYLNQLTGCQLRTGLINDIEKLP